MLRLSLTFSELPILSLRTGTEVAIIKRPLINPDNLKIEGFYVEDLFDKKLNLILLTQDIREILINGFAINDHEVLTHPSELHRLKKVIENNLYPISKPVITETRKRLGKLTEYAVDDQSFYIQKIYVSQSILKNITGGSLILDRSQIIDVTNSNIIVKDNHAMVSASAPQPA